jgi:hypothetical protein
VSLVADPVGPDESLRRFEKNVAAYMTLRADVSRGLPPLKVTADSEEILRATEALADAIRAARPAARAGDVFTNDARPVFLQIIRRTLRENRIPPAALLAELTYDVEPGSPRPAVNGPFPWGRGAIMPGCLIAALPPLPAALQYRFVDRDLVLLDLDADLVVDILTDALPIT